MTINKKDLEILSGFENVNAVFLFGSAAEGKQSPLSDVDLCIIGDLTKEEKSEIYCSFGKKYDISFFDEFPIYIQMRALQGRILFCRDEDWLYRLYFVALRRYEDFKHLLNKRIRENFGKCMI